MRKVGVTGGIGSGKSVVCNHFMEAYQVPTYYTDDEARNLMETDPELVHKLKAKFGDEIYVKGKLNRPFLGQMVFSDLTKLAELNGIVHPVVRKDLAAWFKSREHTGIPYALVESAIMFESGLHLELDYTIVVTADYTTRLSRVMHRDKCSAVEADKKMAAQMNQKDKEKLGDFVLDNSQNDRIWNTDVKFKIAEIDATLTGSGRVEVNRGPMSQVSQAQLDAERNGPGWDGW